MSLTVPVYNWKVLHVYENTVLGKSVFKQHMLPEPLTLVEY